jgi:hypothetical protein
MPRIGVAELGEVRKVRHGLFIGGSLFDRAWSGVDRFGLFRLGLVWIILLVESLFDVARSGWLGPDRIVSVWIILLVESLVVRVRSVPMKNGWGWLVVARCGCFYLVDTL